MLASEARFCYWVVVSRPGNEAEIMTRIKVFVVDDSCDITQYVSHLLSRVDSVTVIGVSHSAEDTLLQLEQIRPDVILMDIKMPGMDGIQCTARIKAKVPQVRVIMLTALADTESVLQSLMAGASGYLCKPFGSSECGQAIEEAYAGGNPLSRLAARAVVGLFQTSVAGRLKFQDLTSRERQIMALLFKDLQDKEIADALGISRSTVHTHMYRLYAKLGVTSRAGAVLKFFEGAAALSPAPRDSTHF